jgi:hypothetical protein
MKKKGPRSIPDFSSKRKSPAPGGTPPVAGVDPKTPAPIPPSRIVKPHATSAKSGRRGS